MSNCSFKRHEPLDSLVCGLPLRTRQARVFLMFKCFADDSGSHGTDEVFVLAGYAAKLEHWSDFTDAWDAELNNPTHPKLEYFKMCAANSRRKQFWGWDEGARDAVLARLASIIKDHVTFGVRATIWWKDYRFVQQQYVGYELHPYVLLLNHVMAGAAHHVSKMDTSEKIEFVFDDQGRIGDDTVAMYRISYANLPSELSRHVLGLPTHKSDKEILPLQAADMIAWQSNRFCNDNATQGQKIENYRMEDTLKTLEQIPMIGRDLNRDGLEEFFKTLKETFPHGAVT